MGNRIRVWADDFDRAQAPGKITANNTRLAATSPELGAEPSRSGSP